MSNFDITKCVTREGTLVNGGTAPDAVDRYGTIKYSFQFENCALVDMFGNLGCIPLTPPGEECDFDMSIFGSAIYPGDWEMQVSTVETIAPHEGTVTDSFNATSAVPVTTFMPLNTVGYLTGVVSGTGTWTIRSGPDTVGGVAHVGSGLLIASGANTHTGPVTLQAGTKLQLGLDCTNTETWLKGSATVNNNATLTQFASMPTGTVVVQNLNNTGTYNLTGCGDCGVGGLYSTIGVTNTGGTINLDNVYWRNTGIWSGVGTVNVKDGATLGLSGQPPAANTVVNINGCGWCNASGVEQGALNLISTATVNYNLKIKVQSASCIKANLNATGTFSGVLSGSAPLTVSGFGTPKPNGNVSFTNTANTYYGTLTADGVTLVQASGNSLQYAKIVLTNGARISSALTQTIGSLASSDPTSSWLIGGSNNVFIKNNGITQFDGLLQMTGSIANVWLEGGSTNQLTLTNTGHTGTVYARNGSKVILEGATFTGAQGQVRVQTGSTVSAGTSTTASVSQLYIDATSALDVRSTGTGTGLIAYTAGQVLSAGWKVNALDPLPPGTYPIIQKPNSTLVPAPTLGINNTGGTVTFTQVGNFLNMVVS